ncbi:MAG: hydroxymyristoyl-ACP dehydratase [Bacteroidetes bacterium]|nr:hydroxymyristoyl-ACP dehydratase [Bacteroidota bacterium]
MLLNKFFKITDIQQAEKYTVSIEMNPAHEVYKGHFPGNPIAPGVCLTQMVKETVEFITKKNLTMVTGDNLKFTAILNPEVNPTVTMILGIKTKDNGDLQADSVVSAETTTFFSIKASYKEN